MRQKSKGKGASRETKERLHIVPASASDVYDFDQQDTSHVNSANLQSEKLHSQFRFPKHVTCGTKVSRKSVKNKILYPANALTEASLSGKTSTPCAATGHQKTKKKTPGTPAPWVVLSHIPQNNLTAYAVSPIAVEHHSPNDLSRQIDVNSMFDDTSSVMDDSAVFISKSSDRVPSSTQCVTEDINDQECNSDKHKSETDSGYPKFDSQCEFISLSSRDNIGIATERSKVNADDLQITNLPLLQNVSDSGDDQNMLTAEKQAQVENMYSSKTTSEHGSADSDCEVVLYKPGMLNPKKFNSSAARSSQKFTTKRHHQVYEDVEPTDKSDDSDAGVSSDVKSKSSVRGKLNQSLRHKPCHALRTRNTAADSNSASALSAKLAPSVKYSRKTDRKTASSVMPSDKSLHSKILGNTAYMENDELLKKPESHHKTTNKQNNENSSREQTENVRIPSVKEAPSATGPDSENGHAGCK